MLLQVVMYTVYSSCFLILPADTSFTLNNICSTLETVQNWRGLSRQLEIPPSKWGKQQMVNYFVTNMPSASWQLLAGALYCLGEQTALTKVTSYFQRQPGMCGWEFKCRNSLTRTCWDRRVFECLDNLSVQRVTL